MKEHTRLAQARMRMERRLFLKSMALGLSAPVAWQISRSAVAQAQEARPKRLMVFFMPHGAPPEHYNPVVNASNPSDFALNQTGVSVLGPLEPFKSQVNVLQGFSYPGASTHEGILTVLSNSGAAINDITTPRTTFEHVIANSLGARPLVLGAVPHRPCGLDKDGMLFWDGQAVVPEQNPAAAFDSLFSGAGDNQPNADAQLRGALNSLTESQISSLASEVSGLTRAANKLSIHLEAVQSFASTNVPTVLSCDSAPQLPTVEQIRQSSAGQEVGNPCGGYFLDDGNFPALLTAQLQVAAQALICNATPVVAVQPMYTNSEVDFAFMGSAGSHHSTLSHTGPQAEGSSLALGTRTPFANAQRWFVEQLVSNVVTPLSQTQDPADPGRTVLDNTIIYMFSEIGEGAWHTTNTRAIQLGAVPNAIAFMPIVTIGGGGGALRTGQVLRFNNDPAPSEQLGQDRPAGDIYLAIARAMGVEVASFGSATNPVTEILA